MHCTRLIALFLVLCPSLKAERAEQFDSPFNGVASSDCSESVALEGFIHSVVTWTDAGDKYKFRISSGPRGDVKAIGLDSGNRYNVVGQTISSYEASKNSTSFGFINTFNVVGLFTVHQTLKLVFDERADPGGFTIKLFVENQKVSCQP